MPFLNRLTSVPTETGGNVNQESIATFSNNITNTVTTNDLTSFATAAHNANEEFVGPAYDTGFISIDNGQVLITNTLPIKLSFVINFQGSLTSTSTVNNGRVGVRLNSTMGLGTGSSQFISAGITPGGTTILTSFNVGGAFGLEAGQSVWLEFSKSFIGTLVMNNCLMELRPLW